MSIPLKRLLLDTNVWVFGLRRDAAHPQCAELLDHIGTFAVIIPLQLIKELNLNLTEAEMHDFYELVNQHMADRVKFFESKGCRKGDAVIAAHAEALEVHVIVSQNRQFLQTVKDLSIQIITSGDAWVRYG